MMSAPVSQGSHTDHTRFTHFPPLITTQRPHLYALSAVMFTEKALSSTSIPACGTPATVLAPVPGPFALSPSPRRRMRGAVVSLPWRRRRERRIWGSQGRHEIPPPPYSTLLQHLPSLPMSTLPCQIYPFSSVHTCSSWCPGFQLWKRKLRAC